MMTFVDESQILNAIQATDRAEIRKPTADSRAFHAFFCCRFSPHRHQDAEVAGEVDGWRRKLSVINSLLSA